MEEMQPQPEALPKAEGEEKRPPSFFHSLAHWAPADAIQLIQVPGKCSLNRWLPPRFLSKEGTEISGHTWPGPAHGLST